MLVLISVVSFCAECIQDTFKCVKNGEDQCLPVEWICDGATDCDNGQDELECGMFSVSKEIFLSISYASS